MEENDAADKVGEELTNQRFQMLEDIARELSGEVVFPTFFDAVTRLRKELSDPALSLQQIAGVVRLEPLVAARIMRLANSVVYNAGGREVNDVAAAVARLGLNVVRATALSIAMKQIMHAREVADFADLARDLWEHSILCAAACRVLARRMTQLNAEEAMLAGLVHDLGAFYMLYRATRYDELRTRPESLRHLVVQWHEGIGVMLLETLGLPADIVVATIDHEQPRLICGPPKTLADVVYVGNVLAKSRFEWLRMDMDQEHEEAVQEQLRKDYADLLPEIEADSQAMLTALS